MQTQFHFNDVLAGVLCIALTSNTIYNLGEVEYQESYERNRLN